jgi:predicted amidophosphoribosyltransferase
MAAARRGGVRGWLRHGQDLLGEIGDAIVSVFLPAGCRICDELLTSASRVPLCAECLASCERVPGILCEICGRPLPGFEHKPDQPVFCPACQEKTYAFERARSFAVYEGAVVRAILLLKFEQIEPLGAWFAERLAELVKAEGEALAADVVVPVPLHRERERERGVQPGGASLQTAGEKAAIAP